MGVFFVAGTNSIGEIWGLPEGFSGCVGGGSRKRWTTAELSEAMVAGWTPEKEEKLWRR